MLTNHNTPNSYSSNTPNHHDSNNAAQHNAVQNNHTALQGNPNTAHHLSLIQVNTQQGHYLSTRTTRDTRSNNRDLYLVRLPASLIGVRCYTDTSTSPDLPSNLSRNTGIGIFIVNNQVHPVQTIYIKATMKGTSSVLMAEGAAHALATTVTKCLDIQQVSFLSDNQQLVNFLNDPNRDDPPDWRIKYYTQNLR